MKFNYMLSMYLIIIIYLIINFIYKSQNTKLNSLFKRIIYFEKKGYIQNISYLYTKNSDISENIMKFKNIINYLHDKYKYEKDIYKKGKVSIKIVQFGNTYREKLYNIINFVNYSKEKNIFVWLSAFRNDNLKNEYSIYLHLLKLGFTNVGLTIACYHNYTKKYVENIIKNNGHIRLVKGYYNDGKIKDINKINKIYLYNAYKIIESKNYHILATHDFKNILSKINNIKNLDNIEFSFFENSINHIEKEMKKYNINFKQKSLHFVFGNTIKHIYDTILNIQLKNILVHL